MARRTSDPASSTDADFDSTDSTSETSEAAPSDNDNPTSADQDASTGAEFIEDNNASVDRIADVTPDLEPDDRVRCQCGAVEWGSQDAGLNPVSADRPGDDGESVRHTVDECRPMSEILAERSGEGSTGSST